MRSDRRLPGLRRLHRRPRAERDSDCRDKVHLAYRLSDRFNRLLGRSSDHRGMLEKLTPKQRAAVALLCQHMTSKEIARRLNIAPSTVDQRLTGAMRRLGLLSRRELARACGNARPARALAWSCNGLTVPSPPLRSPEANHGV